MHKAASEFAKDTLQTEKRDVMVQASQELLKAVTRLMVIADMMDVGKLLRASSRVRNAAFLVQNTEVKMLWGPPTANPLLIFLGYHAFIF